jgi:hypothetical protein
LLLDFIEFLQYIYDRGVECSVIQGARMAIEEISSEVPSPRPEPVAPSEIQRETEPEPESMPEPEPAPVGEDSGKMLDLYV